MLRQALRRAFAASLLAAALALSACHADDNDPKGQAEELSDPVRRARLGAAARALVEANRGANDKSITVLTALLPQEPRAYPANVRPFRPLA